MNWFLCKNYNTKIVRRRRLELPRDYSRYHLKVVRLPVSPPAHIQINSIKKIHFCEMDFFDFIPL